MVSQPKQENLQIDEMKSVKYIHCNKLNKIIVLKTGVVKEPKREVFLGFMVKPGLNQWSNQ